MSHNLTLYIGPADVGLYQTPTEVTHRARYARGDIASRTSESGDFANAKAVYFAWLDEWVEGDRPAIHPRARRGDLVRTWYDEGTRSGGGYVFGVVTKAGPRAFTVRWESGNVQTRPQGCAACSLIPEDELALARTTLGIAEEGST